MAATRAPRNFKPEHMGLPIWAAALRIANRPGLRAGVMSNIRQDAQGYYSLARTEEGDGPATGRGQESQEDTASEGSTCYETATEGDTPSEDEAATSGEE